MNMNFDFNNPTKILFGSGKLNELGSQPLPGKKALLLMSGGKSAKVPLPKRTAVISLWHWAAALCWIPLWLWRPWQPTPATCGTM